MAPVGDENFAQLIVAQCNEEKRMQARFKVEYPGVNSELLAAVAVANAITETTEFYDAIQNKSDGFDKRWTSPGASPAIIAQVLRETRVEVLVRVRKAWRRVLGWTYETEPGVVYLNARRLNRERTSIVATLIHEWVHCVDAVSAHDFHHGDNSPAGKDDSAPYWIDQKAAEMAVRFFKGDNLDRALAQAHALNDGDQLLEGVRLADAHQFLDPNLA